MKLTPAQSKKIRQSAKGERCALQIAGVCNNNPETVVWCHFTDESKGIGIKGSAPTQSTEGNAAHAKTDYSSTG